MKNPGTMTPEDSADLKKLSNEYPYSQIFHILLAKESYDKNLPDKNKRINLAALYSADRRILKEYITVQKPDTEEIHKRKKDDDIKVYPKKTDEPVKDQEVKKNREKGEKTVAEIVEDSPVKNEEAGDTIPPMEHKNLAQEVLLSLEEYKQTMHKYEELEKKLKGKPSEHKKKPDDQAKKVTAKESSQDEPGDKNKNKNLKVVKSEKKSATNLEQSEVTDKPDVNATNQVSKKEDMISEDQVLPLKDEVEDTELIRDHIKMLDRRAEANYRKIKQEKQFELIEKFIENEPELISPKTDVIEEKEDQEDLSFPSTQFGDDLVTENLANIMVKQNNLAKAIDIYKKLIWKFPQKKGYFATQIEKLQEQVNRRS